MRFIFGLGNPGQNYKATRHNVGFMVLDQLACKLTGADDTSKLEWNSHKKSNSLFLRTNSNGAVVSLVKPQTFMNKSGETLKYYLQKQTDWLHQNPISLEKVVVVYDDLDIQLGENKLLFAKGPKLHNGMSSVYEKLGSDAFWHMRVGVDCRHGDRSVSGKEYVLTTFPPGEQILLQSSLKQSVEKLLGWLNA